MEDYNLEIGVALLTIGLTGILNNLDEKVKSNLPLDVSVSQHGKKSDLLYLNNSSTTSRRVIHAKFVVKNSRRPEQSRVGAAIPVDVITFTNTDYNQSTNSFSKEIAHIKIPANDFGSIAVYIVGGRNGYHEYKGKLTLTFHDGTSISKIYTAKAVRRRGQIQE